MDEMKIKMGSKFLRGIVGKVVSKALHKNLGIKPTIIINELEVEMKDGKIHFHASVDGEIDDKVLLKLNRIVDED